MGSNGCEEGGLVRDATFLSAGHVLARTYVHRNEHGLHVHVGLHVPKVVYGSTKVLSTKVRFVLSYEYFRTLKYHTVRVISYFVRKYFRKYILVVVVRKYIFYFRK